MNRALAAWTFLGDYICEQAVEVAHKGLLNCASRPAELGSAFKGRVNYL